MEGLIPYVYRAIVQHRCPNQAIYSALASSASPGDSGRFYMRLPGDSGRFASDIHGLLADALQSPQRICRRPPPQSPAASVNAVNNSGGGRNGGSVASNAGVRAPPAPPAAAVLHAKNV